MSGNIRETIDRVREMSMNGKTVPREDILTLLSIDPYSDDCLYLRDAAKDIAQHVTGKKIRIGISIGVDFAPCTMNCRFCSLGEKWGIVKGTRNVPLDVITETIREYVGKGYFQFVLRTTEFFPNETLCEYARHIRKNVPGRYILVANTGEQTLESAKKLKEAGYNAVYHTVRLGEGKDTDFTPQERLDSIMISKEAGLLASCGLDPIGPEHTDEEIADRLELFRDVIKAVTVCTMKRVAVPGTPMFDLGEISHERHMQLVAVNRLVNGAGCIVPVHPMSADAFEYGANHISVEIGPNPRDDNMTGIRWYPFPPEDARKIVEDAGYEFGTIDDFVRYFPVD